MLALVLKADANTVTFMRELRYELDVEIFGITYMFKQNVF